MTITAIRKIGTLLLTGNLIYALALSPVSMVFAAEDELPASTENSSADTETPDSESAAVNEDVSADTESNAAHDDSNAKSLSDTDVLKKSDEADPMEDVATEEVHTGTGTTETGGTEATTSIDTSSVGTTSDETNADTSNETESIADGVSHASSSDTGLEEMENVTSTATSTSHLSYEMTATTTLGTTTTTHASSSPDQNASTTAAATSTEEELFASSTPTEIVSGTAIALANVLNLVNTNFVNSDGVVVFKNFFETLLDDFDLRDFYNQLVSMGCSLMECNSDGVQTNISNNAIVDNSLFVEATTGGNHVDGAESGAIKTGDAYAGVNLVNVVNTNVIDSNYLLLTMNAFQDVEGDIVFPSLTNFFNALGNSGSPSSINIHNNGEIVNSVTTQAHTGNNTTENSSSSTISTGTSHAATNVFNQLNSTLIGGQNVSILFKVHGDWAGEIFGAPSNLAWMEDGDGGIYLFDKSGGSGGGNTHSVGIAATNTSSIHNNISVVALTGENAITGAETALISTGNAYAGANILNVANETVVGRNWILAIVNIFGNFKGNIAFGRPDLWIGGQVVLPSEVKNNSELKYSLTVINNGDSPASHVELTNTYDAEYLEIYDASLPYTTDDAGALTWELPDLPPGQAVEVTYSARVRNAGNGTDIENIVNVYGRETDNNKEDNTDILTVRTDNPSHSRSKRIKIGLTKEPKQNVSELIDAITDVTVERLTSETTVDLSGNSKVTEHLVLYNNTNDSIPNVTLHDTLYAPDGSLVSDEVWDFGEMMPNEKIEISYDVQFTKNAAHGMYTFATRVSSLNAPDAVFQRNGTILVWQEEEILPFVLGTAVTTEEIATSVPQVLDDSYLTTPIAEASGETQLASAQSSHLLSQYAHVWIWISIVTFTYYVLRLTRRRNIP